MADGISVQAEGEGRELKLVVEVTDDKFAGKQANFQLTQRVRVKRSSPVHRSRELAGRKLALRMGRQEIEFPPLPGDIFTYEGEDIDVELRGVLEIDDGVFFDTKVDLGLERLASLPPRGKAATDAKSVHSPGECTDLWSSTALARGGSEASRSSSSEISVSKNTPSSISSMPRRAMSICSPW
jgi:hypothetical protein